MSWSPSDDYEYNPTRWKAKGEIKVTVPQDDPRTGKEAADAVLWLPFPWVHLSTTPDDDMEEVIEDLRENLPPEMINAADTLLGIDLEAHDFDDAFLVWEVDE